jgi:hypothetical protein
MYAFETRQQFIQHRALGMSLRSIAGKLNIHKNTAQNWDNEYRNDIDAERSCAIGLALSASGAGRIDRAKRSAEILNRLTKKLLADTAPSAQMDNQTLASYIKLCQMLDRVDPPPALNNGESRCDLPMTIDLLANVKMPVRPPLTEQPQPPEPEDYDLSEQARRRNAVKAECTNTAPDEKEELKSEQPEEGGSEDSRTEGIEENERDGAGETEVKATRETYTRPAEEPVDEPFSPMGQLWEIQEKFMG